MKYVMLLLLITAISCKKDGGDLSIQVQGNWELASSYGGWTGLHDYPKGNGNIISFNNNTYTQQVKSADTSYSFTGTFKIFKGRPCDNTEEQMVIQFDNNSFLESISLSEGSLKFDVTQCVIDGGYSTYRKIY